MINFDIFHIKTHITTENASSMLRVGSICGYNKNVMISTNIEACLSDSKSDKENQVILEYNNNVAISTNIETHSSDFESDKKDQVVFRSLVIMCLTIFQNKIDALHTHTHTHARTHAHTSTCCE